MRPCWVILATIITLPFQNKLWLSLILCFLNFWMVLLLFILSFIYICNSIHEHYLKLCKSSFNTHMHIKYQFHPPKESLPRAFWLPTSNWLKFSCCLRDGSPFILGILFPSFAWDFLFPGFNVSLVFFFVLAEFWDCECLKF